MRRHDAQASHCVFVAPLCPQHPGAEGEDPAAHQPAPGPQHRHPRGDLPLPGGGGQPAAGDAARLREVQPGKGRRNTHTQARKNE